MCGRFVAARRAARLAVEFDAIDATGDGVEPSYNVAPTDDVPIIRVRSDRDDPGAPPRRRISLARWGLVPSWARELSVGAGMFNARAETLSEKSAFRRAFTKGLRCLIPADGWYEWAKSGQPRRVRHEGDSRSAKQPYFISQRNESPLAFAGLWESWNPVDEAGEPIISCTLITTQAPEELANIHDRAPLILTRNDWDDWLDPVNESPLHMLSSSPPELIDSLELRPVGAAVGNVRNNDPELTKPVLTEQAALF